MASIFVASITWAWERRTAIIEMVKIPTNTLMCKQVLSLHGPWADTAFHLEADTELDPGRTIK